MRKLHRGISAMYRRNVSVTSALASEVFLGSGSDIGKRAAYFLRSNRHVDLLNLSVNPDNYTDPHDFRDDYLITEILSKYPYLDLGIDREKVAIEKFLIAEKQCLEANQRLSQEEPGSIYSQYTPLSILSMARIKIERLLGPFRWDEAEQHFGFGPGSTTSLPRRKGDAYFKFGVVRPHVTRACSVLAMCAIYRIPRWREYLCHQAGYFSPGLVDDEGFLSLLNIVPGNRITTVPKNAKTDRVIAVEPDLNMFIQKGIGGVIRSRLRRTGIDLNDQGRNQSMAGEASLTDSLATIDLSSASDTVSLQLVRSLLPPDWVAAIELCRSPVGTLPNGDVISYQKVSSMGNGFTFELESLIFWAICSSVISLFRPSESRLTVYGDDIILSSSIFSTVRWILTYCGFTVNEKKSFSNGPFRESCGKHFFKGIDVTPIYIRKDIDSPDRLFWFANSLRRWVRHPVWGLDGRFKKAYDLAVSSLPKELRRHSIPDGLGDIALMGDFDEARPYWSKRLQQYVGQGYADIQRTFVPGGIPYLLRQLAKPGCLSGDAFLRDLRGGGMDGVCTPTKPHWKLIKLPITLWESYGEWLPT